MLNRSAVVVRYREAFRDWLRSIGVEEEEFEDHGDKSVYLIGECEYPEDREEILRESAGEIFSEEVSAWHLDSEQYPDFNDFTLFTEWFETEFFDMVSDALDEPLTKGECPVLPVAVTLTPVAEPDFAVVRELAGTIWRQQYAAIISLAQIEYMLATRFSDDALWEHIQAADRWLELLRVGQKPVGYCGYELASLDGDEVSPAAMKLGQLYLLESHRGMGLGWHMLRHIEARARELGRRVLWLQVSKKNAAAIGFYRSAGLEVIREAVFDIGGGFVMDDYVMAKQV